jgi:hypothetical protein
MGVNLNYDGNETRETSLGMAASPKGFLLVCSGDFVGRFGWDKNEHVPKDPYASLRIQHPEKAKKYQAIHQSALQQSSLLCHS